jgi:hypothetical protein
MPEDNFNRPKGSVYVGKKEAIATAFKWALGHKSHVNEMIALEADPEDRRVTMALTSFADAQEVVKWSAYANALEHRPSLTDEMVEAAAQAIAHEFGYKLDSEIFDAAYWERIARVALEAAWVCQP